MINPHGSETLKPLLVSDDAARLALAQEAESLPSLVLNSAAAANAVMLGGGYFTPLDGYMNLADALSVAETMHTKSGLFWPVPVLNLTDDIGGIEGANRIALRDPNVDGQPVIAVMEVASIEPVSAEQIEAAIARVVHRLRTTGEREVPARLVGELVMDELKKLDEVAYVRFASVYRRFQDVQEFREEVERLQEAASGNREQMSLLRDED